MAIVLVPAHLGGLAGERPIKTLAREATRVIVVASCAAMTPGSR